MREWQFLLSLAIARTGGLKRWGYNVDGQSPVDGPGKKLQTNDGLSQNLVSSSTQSQGAVIILDEAYQMSNSDLAENILNTGEELVGPSTSTPIGSPVKEIAASEEYTENISHDTSISRKRRMFDVEVSPISMTLLPMDKELSRLGFQAMESVRIDAAGQDQLVPDNSLKQTAVVNSPKQVFDNGGDMKSPPVTPPPRSRMNLHKTPAPAKCKDSGMNATGNSEHIGNITVDTQATEYCFNVKVPEKNGSKTREFWNNALARQSNVLRQIATSSQSRMALVTHAVESWKILTMTYDSFMIRSSDLYDGIQCFASNALKFYEFLTLRGCEEVSSLPHEFISSVLSRYLASQPHMHPHSRCWISSREIVSLIFSQLTNLDIQLSLLALLNEIQLKFIARWSTGSNVPFERNDEFVTYCLGEITGLINQCSQRVGQLNKRRQYSLLC